MNELFQLSAPWWVFVLRATAIYALVMVLVRVSGKRAVGQFTPFDLVLLILIGNAVPERYQRRRQLADRGGDHGHDPDRAELRGGLRDLAAAAARALVEERAGGAGAMAEVFDHVLQRELGAKRLPRGAADDIASG